MSWFRGGGAAAPQEKSQMQAAVLEMEMMTDLFNKMQRGRAVDGRR